MHLFVSDTLFRCKVSYPLDSLRPGLSHVEGSLVASPLMTLSDII